jgi:hypothetical protein
MLTGERRPRRFSSSAVQSGNGKLRFISAGVEQTGPRLALLADGSLSYT